MKRNRLWVLLTAFAMTFLVAGTVLAATGPSAQGVTPTEVSGNITLTGEGNNDAADCDAADGIETGDTGGSDTTDNGVSVSWTYDSTSKEFGFTATGGVVLKAYVKGSNSYNVYDYTGLGGVTSDSDMFAPDNASDGPAGLSHAVFCTGPSAETSSTTSFESSEESTTDVQSSSTESSSSTTSFSDSVSDTTSQPPTDTIGNTGSGQQSSGLWMLLAALGVLAGSVIVLAPSKAKSKD
jgi:hypothetical protein